MDKERRESEETHTVDEAAFDSEANQQEGPDRRRYLQLHLG